MIRGNQYFNQKLDNKAYKKRKKVKIPAYFIMLFLGFICIGLNIINETKSKNTTSLEDHKEEYTINDLVAPKIQEDESEKEPTLDLDSQFSILKSKIRENTGVFGLYIEDIESKNIYSYNSTKNFYGASLYKLPIAYSIVKKIQNDEMSWDTVLTYNPRDYSDGTGSITNYPYGTEFTIKRTIELLFRQSDNSAQLMLEHLVGEPYLADTFKDVVLYPDENNFYLNNITNPKEISKVIEEIFYSEKLISENKTILKSFLHPTVFDDRITPYLDNNLTFYHKIGSWPNSFHDCGIVSNGTKDIIVCLMSNETNISSFNKVCSEVGKFVNLLFE